MSLAPGTRLSFYEVLDLIGAGGMGEVYRARDTKKPDFQPSGWLVPSGGDSVAPHDDGRFSFFESVGR